MALPATDNFTGTNGTALTTYSANWSNVVGAFAINSNSLYTNYGAGDAAARWNADTFSNDQYAEATVVAITSGAYIGVAVRCSASAETFYSFTANDNTCYLSKYVNGSYTDLGSGGGGFAVNDVIRLEANGTSIVAKINGATEFSVTDSGIASGSAGVGGSGTATGSRIDGWSAGNLGSAAIEGSLSATLGAITSSVAGTVALAGSLSATLGAITVSAAGEGELAAGEGSLSATLGAITATAAGGLAITGATSATFGAITATARGYHVEGACIGGVLTADTTNARYFRNDSGIVVLTGAHTWYTLTDGGVSDPPPTFDYDAWLSFVAERGGNTFKLWAMRTPKDWPDEVDARFSPLPWPRTGPGNAADGKLKFDLSKWDNSFFERLEERAVKAGNEGFYVIVQLEQGWHADQKGLGSGDPAAYHPFASANNINSIDGNPDDDADILETRVYNDATFWVYFTALARKIVDTVGYLDNVLFEISNEETATTAVTEWQQELVNYIQGYDSRSHPVGMTWQYPNGSNTTDLYTSNADWISYGGNNSSPLDSPVVWPDTGATGKINLWDTDHMGGLVLDGVYAWKAFCRGHGGVLFMDSYNGAFGDDWTANTTAEKIRNNLGYMQDYAARIDLANATPQGSLASTGYCLAKTTGRQQLIAYQPTSGNFTVDLSGMAGTFSVEFLRTSSGATSTTTVAGGAERTITAPWAGEDFVAFLELSAVDGTLSATLGAITLTAAGEGLVSTDGSLSATLGAITATAAGALAITADASATLGAITASAAGTVDLVGELGVTLGAITASATGATGTFATGELSATMGGITVAADGTLALAATATATFGAVTVEATATLDNSGALTATMGAMTLTAVGVEVVIVSIVAGAIRGAGASGTVHGAGASGSVRA